MQYSGQFEIFDPEPIKTYPVKARPNKLNVKDLLDCRHVLNTEYSVSDENAEKIEQIAAKIIESRQQDKPVICFTGAHLIKNGLGPLLTDLVRRDIITLAAGNCATAIHDFELALFGQTSEHVPDSLKTGKFGMAYEFCYINEAINTGDKYQLGLGEALGRMICDEKFRSEVLSIAAKDGSPDKFLHPQTSLIAACFETRTPFTVHVGIGTDVIDQHPSSNAGAKGACSGRDFLIYAKQFTKLTNGGVVLNIGSAVTGPEVALKAASMAANTGTAPKNIITADFDIRQFNAEDMDNETRQNYYLRDQKTIVTRLPQAFGGKGYYVQGNQKDTVPALYKKIIEGISK